MKNGFRSRLLIFNLMLSLFACLSVWPRCSEPLSAKVMAGTNVEATLLSVKVKFHTNGDDKDQNTTVSVSVKLANNKVIAQSGNITEAFEDDTYNGPYTLTIVPKPFTKAAIQGGVAIVATSRPGNKGHDRWKFDFVIELVFRETPTNENPSGITSIVKEFQGKTLDENEQAIFSL